MKRSLNTWCNRTITLLMCCSMLAMVLVCFGGCQTPSAPPVYDTRLNFLSDNGMSIYRIVYPKDDCPDTVLNAAQELQDIMSQTLGVDVAITDDRGTANATDQLQPYEILIGRTARAASQKILPELDGEEYVIRVDGHKIVIVGATNRATYAGVRYFIDHVILQEQPTDTPDRVQIKIEANYEYWGQYVSPKVPVEDIQTTLPVAPYRASDLYTVAFPDDANDQLTLVTLQGLAAKMGSEQIYIMYDGCDAQLASLIEKGDITVTDCNDGGQAWTLGRLLNYYCDRLNGYILCSNDMTSESVEVAINLAHQLNAVVITLDNEEIAQAAGLSLIMDVTDKDDAWLRASEYFGRLNHSVAIEPDMLVGPTLADYAVMTGCYYRDYCQGDEYMHVQQFRHLEKGGYLLTAPTDDVHHTVSFEAIGVNVLKLDTAYLHNFSVMMGKLPAEMEALLFPQP